MSSELVAIHSYSLLFNRAYCGLMSTDTPVICSQAMSLPPPLTNLAAIQMHQSFHSTPLLCAVATTQLQQNFYDINTFKAVSESVVGLFTSDSIEAYLEYEPT